MALSQPGTVLGTAGYMSPDRCRSTRGRALDIFSFGAVLYEMLTGGVRSRHPPAWERMHADLNADPPEFDGELGKLPPSLATIVRRCLEKRPEQRFQIGSRSGVRFTVHHRRQHHRGSDRYNHRSARAQAMDLDRCGIGHGRGVVCAGFFLRDRTLRRSQPGFQKITFRKGLVARARNLTPDGNIVYQASWDHGPSRIYLAGPGSPEFQRPGN